ncbi:MAG: ATP-binding protein [Candidatus Nitrospinota bacterium M3_3B_026]
MSEKEGKPDIPELEDRLAQALKEKEVFAKALVEFNQSFDQKVRELSIIRRISDELLASFDLESILRGVLNVISEEVTLINCSIMLLDNSGENLVLRAARGVEDEGAVVFDEASSPRRIRVGSGVAGTVVKVCAPALLQDVTNDARFAVFPGSVEIGSLLCLPLITKGRALGVLNLSDIKPLAFTPEDERVLVIVAGQLAGAIENARLIDRLLENEKLTALGKMAATMIHDMKNPMQVISGYAEMLAGGKLEPEERRRFYEIITRQVDRFEALAEETLEFVKGAESKLFRQLVKLRDFAEDVESGLKPEFDRLGIEIESSAPDLGVMNVDNARMMRVMFNLAANARDAMPSGGTLRLTCSRREDGAVIEVEDTGEGIPKEVRARLFEPFITFGKDNGTGLGLAIVKKIVEGHGGTIRVEDGRDGGARFIMEMPDK